NRNSINLSDGAESLELRSLHRRGIRAIVRSTGYTAVADRAATASTGTAPSAAAARADPATVVHRSLAAPAASATHPGRSPSGPAAAATVSTVRRRALGSSGIRAGATGVRRTVQPRDVNRLTRSGRPAAA